jgi:hypothetical protein
MIKLARSLAVLALNSAVGLAATPAAAQPASAVCNEAIICVGSTVVHAWPLDRWSTVRQASR